MKSSAVWIIIAISLILIGGIVFVGVMANGEWDFKKLSTVTYETNEYDIVEEYKNITVKTNTADILIVPNKAQETRIVCCEENSEKHSVGVEDGCLKIEVVETKKWYEHIGVNFGAPKITVYIPQGEYGALDIETSTGKVKISKEFKFENIDILCDTGDVTDFASATGAVKIKTSTGGIMVKDISAHALSLSVSTGKVTVLNAMIEEDVQVGVSTGKTNITNAKCKNLTSGGDTGDITLKDVVALEKISMERSTGDVEFERSDAAEISVSTDTGDVSGSLLTDKIFVVSTDTGRVEVPKTTSGGTCEITTDTGDIKFNIVS